MTKIETSGDQKPRAGEAKIVITVPAATVEERSTMAWLFQSLTENYFYELLLWSCIIFWVLMILVMASSVNINYPQIMVFINNFFNSSQPQNSSQPASFITETRKIPYALSDEFIQRINEKTDHWEAGRNFPTSTSMRVLRKMMGVKEESQFQGSSALQLPLKVSSGNFSDLPAEFDARLQWPDCPSLREIRDQGGCGSCWAFGAVETMTDRHCIAYKTQFHYSAEDLLSCCTDCGDGCDGGWPQIAFTFWLDEGIVSGGNFESKSGCQPYVVPACEHHVDGPRPNCNDIDFNTPQCVRSCIPEYNSLYADDKHSASKVYRLFSEDEILNDLVEHGPLEASFDVYEDFLHYKSGVYHHVSGDLLGGHAVKVIGYGVENDIPYYLCSNSWNTDWGDNGFFKIKRDEMDSVMYTGIPKQVPSA
ncbi:cathepsin B [Hyalella azteca]|uniref:Cathepsin B n=2 Tax=Hyalella azteca TaxID=294128 RepID=A0A8B7NBF6_HYAAZ|nr:cathepsin B [Hyalella azteca]